MNDRDSMLGVEGGARQRGSAERAPRSRAPALHADLKALAILLLVTVTLRGWLLFTTEVAARDSVGYIRQALELENPHMTWGDVLRKNEQHPGYPLAILAVSKPVRALLDLTPFSMQFSAQLVSGLAAILLVFPMFYLGKALHDRATGFWGALLFQFLPLSAHTLSDGCSEALYFLFIASALLAGIKAMQGTSLWRFGLCGALCALAYLVRPEGAIILVAMAVVLLAVQWVPGWRRPWLRMIACGSSLTVAALLVGSLYFGFTHCFTNKPAAKEIMHLQISCHDDFGTRFPLLACIWGVHADTVGKLGVGRALGMLATELVQGFHYVGGLAVLLGLWWFRGLLRQRLGPWILIVVGGLYCLVLIRLGMSAGYISDRHVMVMIMCGCYPAAAALRKMPRRWLQRGSRIEDRVSGIEDRGLQIEDRRSRFSILNPQSSILCLMFMLAFCLPKTLQPLHANRAGHHAAGLWLEQHVHPGDQVVDDHCWAHYYAGLVFEEGKTYPATIQPACYTVIGRTRDPRDDKGRKHTESAIQAAGGKVVYSWPPDRSPEAAKVVVYVQHKDGDSR